jgi:predicted Zn-dependent peptidase
MQMSSLSLRQRGEGWGEGPHFSRALLLSALTISLSANAAAPLEERVKELRLANGMTWLVVERPEAPLFTGYVRVRVGGADETPGSTGLAHLFEHMAFKGTPKLGAKDWEAEQPLLLELQRAGDALATLQRQGKANTDEGKQLAA